MKAFLVPDIKHLDSSPIFGLGCAKMQAAWNDLQRLESLITPAAAAWQQGDNFQMDSSLLPLLSRYEEHGNQ